MIEWDDNYSMNISIIDKQHKELIDIINKAIAAKQHRNNPEEISEIIYDMTIYAQEHFKTEEAYMEKFNYPEYQYHKQEHLNFSTTTLVYGNRENKGGFRVVNEILEFLQQWLVHHIQETDKAYTDFLNKKRP